MLVLSSVNLAKKGLITDLTQESTDYCLCVFVSYRYNASVNFTEGRCPGSKAMAFYEPSADVTIPNLNIGDPDFAIAFWIRLSKPYQRVTMWCWSRSAIGFEISFRERSLLCFILTANRRIAYCALLITSWIHIAVTFEQDEVKIFINGENFRTVSITTLEWRNPIETCDFHYVSSPLIMDLDIFGFALPRDDIYDLSRGKQFVYFMKILNTLFHNIIAWK